MARDNVTAADALITVRDLLRYAVSRFAVAGLSYGHGTSNGPDEAAFLILETLRLPIDDLEPWLDARLTRAERLLLLSRFEARIATRKPAPYLTGSAYIKGHRFIVDERTIVPRSFIGEILCDNPEYIADPAHVGRVLDLGTGGGSLAILAALAFADATLDAVDLSAPALALARLNIRSYGLEDRIGLLEGDLFAPVGTSRYDLIVANPPYVTTASLAAFPPEFAAEPRLAHDGGADGLDIVRRVIADAGRHLEPDGVLIVEIGAGRSVLEAAYPKLPFEFLDTETSAGEVFRLTASALQPRQRGTE